MIAIVPTYSQVVPFWRVGILQRNIKKSERLFKQKRIKVSIIDKEAGNS
jgi:hypothetical protein